MNRKSVLLGLAVTVSFSLLYVPGLFESLEARFYDSLLNFRSDRELSGDVVFLDIDDNAIAYNGVFPWPRSVTAEGLLRLKEYGARAAIFDVEYIDKGPQGVDTIYLDQGLPADFDRSFDEINSNAEDVFYAIKSGSIRSADLDDINMVFSSLVNDERKSLYNRARGVARDNDLYMIRASALFGRSWASLNLRDESQGKLEGEQAERRYIAEEKYAYPIIALQNAYKGKYIDVLPALPGFALAAKSAGFTNVEIDKDGTRRRIDLAQNIHDHWYLQLAFAPLINYLGNPEIELSSSKMLIKSAAMPGGMVKDIVIPLDGKGRMVLDWPKKDYLASYSHISFGEFSRLESLEADLEKYTRELAVNNFYFFAQYDPYLASVPFILNELGRLFEFIRTERNTALENNSDKSFAAHVECRAQTREKIQEILDIDPGVRVIALIPELTEALPDMADAIRKVAEEINAATANLMLSLDKYEELRGKIESTVKDKFCILGRVDTGTTDYGANPFFGKYVNVGTHGVVLDMILSESFIVYIGKLGQAAFALVFVFLFFLASAKLTPVPRAISGFLATVLVIASLALLFRYTGYFINPLLTIVSMVSAVILREIVSYAGSEREKQFIRKAFSTYVSDDVVKEIISDPSRLQLGGTKRHMSAIFTDVEGFSGISEQLDPENLVSLLNRYLTFMSDAILEEKGTIDKYEGDAIIAFFGAPMPLPDHAVRACESAIVMRRIEKDLNKKIMEEKLSPRPLLTRIGINTGSMVAGNMGTGNKMNYTIMGNAVNLAARLEGVNKQYGTWIIASDDTVKETGDHFLTRKLDRVRVVGINEPVRLHELLETMEMASGEQKKLVEVFHAALDFYENRKWKEAIEGFKESLAIENCGPSAKYLERCEVFIKHPPGDNWDGVHNLTEK
jgi:adenylate cyclase